MDPTTGAENRTHEYKQQDGKIISPHFGEMQGRNVKRSNGEGEQQNKANSTFKAKHSNYERNDSQDDLQGKESRHKSQSYFNYSPEDGFKMLKTVKVGDEDTKSVSFSQKMSSESSGTSPETQRKKVLPAKLPSQSPLTPIDLKIVQEFNEYVEMERKYQTLLRRQIQGSDKLNTREMRDLDDLSKTVRTLASQQKFNSQLRVQKDQYKFFGPVVKKQFPFCNFKEINNILNESLILRGDNSDHAKLFSLLNLIKRKKENPEKQAYRRLIRHRWSTLPASGNRDETSAFHNAQFQFHVMYNYWKKLKSLCEKWRDSTHDSKDNLLEISSEQWLKNERFFHGASSSQSVHGKDKTKSKKNKKADFDNKEKKPKNDNLSLIIEEITGKINSSLNKNDKKHKIKINDILEVYSQRKSGTAFQNKDEIINEISDIIDLAIVNRAEQPNLIGKYPELIEKLIEAIDLYIQKNFIVMLQNKAAEVLENYQTIHRTEFLMYKDFKEQWKKQFETPKTPSTEELIRSIESGTLSFFDSNNNLVLAPFKSPINKSPNEVWSFEERVEHEKALDDYVFDCQFTVGQYLFKDGEMMKCICKILERIASAVYPPEPGETQVNKQKRIANYLEKFLSDPNLAVDFMSGVTRELHEWNDKRKEDRNLHIDDYPVQVILQTLLRFYGVTSQNNLWGGMGALIRMVQELFPTMRAALKSLGLDVDDQSSKETNIIFNPGSVGFIFGGKYKIFCPINMNRYYYIIPKLTIKIPNPGGDELKDPVTLDFFYEKPSEPVELAKESVILKTEMQKISENFQNLKGKKLEKARKELIIKREELERREREEIRLINDIMEALSISLGGGGYLEVRPI